MGSVAIAGDGCEGKILESAGARRADILVALTGEDEDNLVTCQIAKHYFKIPRTIARVMDERNEQLFKKLGVDITINTTNIILEYIKHELPSPPVLQRLSEAEKSFEVVDVTIPVSSSMVGRNVGDLKLPPGAILALVIRKDKTPLVPEAATTIERRISIAVTRPQTKCCVRLTAITSRGYIGII
jgi:trk system potassium uptake protein TrkA